MKRDEIHRRMDAGELHDPAIEIDSELIHFKSLGGTIPGRSSVVEEKDVAEIADEGILKTVHYERIFHAGCGHVIHQASELAGTCHVCKKTVCASCNLKPCQRCGNGCCPSCRLEEDGEVICRLHTGYLILRGIVQFLTPEPPRGR